MDDEGIFDSVLDDDDDDDCGDDDDDDGKDVGDCTFFAVIPGANGCGSVNEFARKYSLEGIWLLCRMTFRIRIGLRWSGPMPWLTDSRVKSAAVVAKKLATTHAKYRFLFMEVVSLLSTFHVPSSKSMWSQPATDSGFPMRCDVKRRITEQVGLGRSTVSMKPRVHVRMPRCQINR